MNFEIDCSECFKRGRAAHFIVILAIIIIIIIITIIVIIIIIAVVVVIIIIIIIIKWPTRARLATGWWLNGDWLMTD